MPEARPRPGVRRGIHVVPPLLVLVASFYPLGGCFSLASPTLASDPVASDAGATTNAGGGAVASDAGPLPISIPPVSDDASPPPEAAAPPPSSPIGSGADAAPDAAPEASSPSPASVRCGGAPQTSFCSGNSSCCATLLPAGFDYACNPGECGGISIFCADRSDCKPGQVCCIGSSIQACTSAPACPIGHEACDPNAATPCLLGGVCQQLAFDGFLVPYFGCQ